MLTRSSISALLGMLAAWTWDVWGQSLDLITSYDGTPSAYGQTFKIRFQQ